MIAWSRLLFSIALGYRISHCDSARGVSVLRFIYNLLLSGRHLFTFVNRAGEFSKWINFLPLLYIEIPLEKPRFRTGIS